MPTTLSVPAHPASDTGTASIATHTRLFDEEPRGVKWSGRESQSDDVLSQSDVLFGLISVLYASIRPAQLKRAMSFYEEQATRMLVENNETRTGIAVADRRTRQS